MAKTAGDRKKPAAKRGTTGREVSGGAQTAAGGVETPPATAAARLDDQLQRRVVVEGVQPEVDAGRFPIKRTAGEDVVVAADIYTDGHDTLAAALLYRRSGEAWRETPMTSIGNDRWQASFR